MTLLGNLIWLVFGGIFIFLHYAVSGVLLLLTIIGIPFAVQIFKLAVLSLWPFGKTIVDRGGGSGCLGVIMNILWLLLGGIWISIHHLVWAILLGITIVGLPFAKQHIKLAGLALVPFGKDIE
ncbi:MAG: YccF domain-containing protein [Myxococcota bacterium]|nr:YccF domain-containing protein [Myxococcota bacterium]